MRSLLEGDRPPRWRRKYSPVPFREWANSTYDSGGRPESPSGGGGCQQNKEVHRDLSPNNPQTLCLGHSRETLNIMLLCTWLCLIYVTDYICLFNKFTRQTIHFRVQIVHSIEKQDANKRCLV